MADDPTPLLRLPAPRTLSRRKRQPKFPVPARTPSEHGGRLRGGIAGIQRRFNDVGARLPALVTDVPYVRIEVARGAILSDPELKSLGLVPVYRREDAIHASFASLKLPNKVPALITYGQGIVKAMTGNVAFPSPTPTLAAITEAINELQLAETAALARTKGAVAVRNEKRAVLVTLLRQLRGSIQATADAAPETSASVIQSAGVALRKVPVHAKRVFAAKVGPVSGSAHLVTEAASRRASYEWQYSTDGGKTWVSAPSTLQTKTIITGLTPGATVVFRYRAVTKTGEGDWSQQASLIVK